ncbi:MAG TPA: ATPase domain-containing protein, partial [Candidatus Obscuribacterales bacterium]
IHRWLSAWHPTTVVIDPISNLTSTGSLLQTKSFFMRLIDHLKAQQITVLMTNLIAAGTPLEHTEVGISSLMDTWLEVRSIEHNGERNRLLQVLKSRGMSHSNQVREFRLTSQGIELVSVYLGQGQVLVGTARAIQEVADDKARVERQQQVAARRRQLEQQRQATQTQLAMLQLQLEAESTEFEHLLEEERLYAAGAQRDQATIAQLRQAD